MLAGCAFPLVPTVAINAAWWGQADTIYTAFLLGCFRATLARRPALAMLLFGVALSFKLQSIFLAPYLAILVLRRDIPVWHLLIAPAVYAVMMVPAWLDGRPALELATIYLSQRRFYQGLSMGAPNPWMLLQELPFVSYGPGVAAGLAVTVAAFLLVLYRAVTTADDTVEFKVLVAALSVLLAPYLLPKMHDRYFFPADVFTLLLVFLPGRLKLAPLLMQAASLSAYAAFLVQRFGSLPKDASFLAPVAASAAVWLVRQEFWQRTVRRAVADEWPARAREIIASTRFPAPGRATLLPGFSRERERVAS